MSHCHFQEYEDGTFVRIVSLRELLAPTIEKLSSQQKASFNLAIHHSKLHLVHSLEGTIDDIVRAHASVMVRQLQNK